MDTDLSHTALSEFEKVKARLDRIEAEVFGGHQDETAENEPEAETEPEE